MKPLSILQKKLTAERQKLEDRTNTNQVTQTSTVSDLNSTIFAMDHHSKPDPGAQIGILDSFNSKGLPRVRLAKDSQLYDAISTIPIDRRLLGRTVVLLLECGGARQFIIVGLLPAGDESQWRPQTPVKNKAIHPTDKRTNSVHAKLDNETLVLTAKREIQLHCGEASITLTRAGKVIIKGQYVLSRSKGANKIKGAYVDIN